jgi:hypothetical protein
MRIAIFILLSALAMAPAQARECTAANAIAADAASDYWQSWSAIFGAYKRYGQCDNGAPGEGFADDIVHVLATKWGSLREAQRFINQQPAFEKFIVQHIDATTDYDELILIERHATNRCPASAKILCAKILSAAKKAVAEIAAPAPN